jgi:hypothetical protein
MSLSSWKPGEPARRLQLDEQPGEDELLWCDLGAIADPPLALQALEPLCPGLEVDMLEELMTADRLPEDREWYDGEIKLASTCALAFTDGAVIVQQVELLASETWLITSWHEARKLTDADEETAAPDVIDRQGCVEAVERRWRAGNGATAGDLGVLVMHELALTYAPAERELRSVLEDWELRLYEGDRTPQELTDQREALRRLWRLRAVLRDWVAPLNRPGMSLDLDKVWLPASDHAEAIKVDDRVDRVLENLATLGEALRSSFHLVHLEESERERDRREQVQRQVELVAAIFIVPTFIFGLYGSNTWLPGQGSRIGFAIMIAIVLAVTGGSVLLLQRWQRDRGPGT